MQNVRHFCGQDYSQQTEGSEHFRCVRSVLQDAVQKIPPEDILAPKCNEYMYINVHNSNYYAAAATLLFNQSIFCKQYRLDQLSVGKTMRLQHKKH